MAVDFNYIAHLSQTTLNAFITLNPQLEKVTVIACPMMTSSVLSGISDRLPNLIQLAFECYQTMTIPEYNEFVMHLSQLQKLRRLSLILHTSYPADILIDSLVTNIPAIEKPFICGCFGLEKCVTGLLKLSCLKALDLSHQISLIAISVSVIIELIHGLSALKEIDFYCDTISVSEIMNILEYSKDMKMIRINILKMNIDLPVHKTILASIRGQLKLTLKIYSKFEEMDC